MPTTQKNKEEIKNMVTSNDWDAFNRYRESTNFIELDLRGLDLSLVDVNNFDFRYCDMRGCQWPEGAELGAENFNGCAIDDNVIPALHFNFEY